ncbi:MAG: serine/threonine-protein kinase, partial [Byssovorax sp.]
MSRYDFVPDGNPRLDGQITIASARVGVRGISGDEAFAKSTRLRRGQILAEKYEIDGFLGRGGMGEVVSAKQLTLNRRVAIKVLTGAGDGDERVARFLREARATARIESEHAARIIDVGELDDGTPYFVMEYLEGKDLQHLLSESGPFSLQMAANVIIQACAALAAAHAHQIVHRDIKPSNLFVTRRPDGTLLLKVLDFGISKVVETPGDSALTQMSARFGTPPYMSPEQIRSSARVDHQTDIWSLGVVLYELLAGVLPFDAPTRDEVFARIEEASPRPIGERCPELPVEVARLIEGCLERDCAARISDVGEIAGILEPFASEDARPLVRSIERLLAGRAIASARSSPEIQGEVTVDRIDTEATWPPELPSAAQPLATTEPALVREEGWIGKVLPGGLSIERCIGQGSMGAVYKAVRDTGEPVAVKLILASLVDDRLARERFSREATAVASLSNRHVVRIVDPGLGEMDGYLFIAMELLQGQTLGDWIGARGPLSPAVAALAFVQVCEGLSEAHGRALVHRDIKPANLFLHETKDGEIVIKVCDFGIAKLDQARGAAAGEQALTGAWQVIGTPVYMSPEHISDPRSVSARSDVWSVSVSLYEALAGVRPWPSPVTARGLVTAILAGDARPLGELAPWLDPDLVRVVHRGLEPRPEARWESVEELGRALLPFTEGKVRLDREALESRPDIAPSRPVSPPAQPLVRRSSRRSWVLAAVALATVVGGSVLAKGCAGKGPDIA